MTTGRRPWAIYYEHPHWFQPLFNQLKERGHPFLALRPEEVSFDISCPDLRYEFLFNRMSPSAYLRGRASAILFTQNYLAHVERQGVPIVNGVRAYRLETSKVLQLKLLSELGIPFPHTVVIHHRSQVSAARKLRFPVVSKPNLGGSGAGIARFDNFSELAEAATAGQIDAGLDGTLLIQEYIAPADGRVTRVEMLGGRLLYALHIHSDANQFNLCPADICNTVNGQQLKREAVAEDAPQTNVSAARFNPGKEVVEEVVRIVTAAGIDVGGIEYVESARDGKRYYFDINALSNFVADPLRVLGFDPVTRLVDYLERINYAYSAA